MGKAKTYLDRLMQDEEFRKRFEEEYQNLCLGKQITRARHQAHLTQHYHKKPYTKYITHLGKPHIRQI